jgi:hypothetical protein
VILVGLLPSLIFAERKATNPYVNTVISHIIVASDGGKLVPVEREGIVISDPYQHGHIGFQGILLAVVKVCGVSPKYVQFLPIGGVLVPLLYYVLFKKILGSDMMASLFTIYVAYEPMLSKGHFSIQAYAWSRTLLMVFLVLCIRMLNKRTAANILLLVMIYAGTFLIYWTTPIWMLTLWASITILPMLQTLIIRRTRDREGNTLALVLVFLIIYLGFSKVLYQYLPAVADAVYGGPDEGWSLFSWQIRDLLGGNRESGPYEYAGALVAKPLLGWLLAARYIVLFVPHAIYILSRIKDVIKTRSLASIIQDQADLVIWGSFFLVFVHVGAYAMRGHVSLRPAILVFPITGIMCISQLKFPKSVGLVFALTLVFLSVVGFYLHYQETSSYDVESSAQWLLDHSEEATALTDIYTSQKHLLEQIEKDRWLTMTLYDPSAYRFLIQGEQALTDEQTGREWDYVIIDMNRLEQPVLSGGWIVYEPLSNHFQEIQNNTSLNVVYDEGRFLILRANASLQ